MFEAKTTPGFFAVPPTSRLRWLVRLRWLALLGVAVGLGVAQAARFAWVSAGPIAIALAVGVFYNLAFLVRLRRLEHSAQRALRAIADAAGSASGQTDADVSVSTIRALAEVAGTSPERSGRRGLVFAEKCIDQAPIRVNRVLAVDDSRAAFQQEAAALDSKSERLQTRRTHVQRARKRRRECDCVHALIEAWIASAQRLGERFQQRAALRKFVWVFGDRPAVRF